MADPQDAAPLLAGVESAVLAQLLGEAFAAGLSLSAADDRLIVDAPLSAAPIVRRLRAAESAVLEFLRARDREVAETVTDEFVRWSSRQGLRAAWTEHQMRSSIHRK